MELERNRKSGRRFALKSLKSRLDKLPRWFKWVMVVLLAGAVIIGVLTVQSKNQPVSVTAVQIKKQDLERTVFTNGRLEAVNTQKFFSPVSSTLMELNVELGDRVKKGDVLGRLDTLELARLYENARAILTSKEAELARIQAVDENLNLQLAEKEYEKAKNHHKRITALYEAGAVGRGDLETADVEMARAEVSYHEALAKSENSASAKEKASLLAQVELARQEAALAKERLDMATFIAEEDGVVLAIGAQQGNEVQEGTLLLEIGNDKELKVTAGINEIDAGNLTVGQPVEIKCLALPGQEFKGEITRVGAAAVIQRGNNGETVNIPVTIQLKGNAEGLKTGYTVDLTIRTITQKNVLTVPVEALVERDGESIVYVVEDGSVEERQIKTKIGNELYDIVLSGLKPGEEVVVNPDPILKEGQKVEVTLAGDKDD